MNKKRYHAVWLVFGLAIILGALLLISKISDEVHREHEFSDHAIRVKAPSLEACGDAFLFYNQEGAVLIDTGEEGDSELLLSAIEEAGVGSLDAMILTHYDKDHIGGAPALLKKIPVRTCYMTIDEKDSPEYKALMEGLAGTDTRQVLLTDKESFECMGASFTMYPPTSLHFEEDADNNLSLITSISYGKSRLLFAGDAMNERMEQFYERQYDGTAYQFLKVPHHGRNKKVIARMMDYFTPEAALITSSEDEPEKESLVNVLKDQGVEVFLTREGQVDLVIDQDCISVRQGQKECQILTAAEGGQEDTERSETSTDTDGKKEKSSESDDRQTTPAGGSGQYIKDGDLLINEVGTDGSHDGVWVELYNRTDRELSLSGFSLSDNKNKLFKYRFSAGQTIPSEGYLLLYFNEDKKPETEEDVDFCPVDGFTLSGSETLYLASQGRVIDAFQVPLWIKEGVSCGRQDDGEKITDVKNDSEAKEGKESGKEPEGQAALSPSPGSSNAGAQEKSLLEAPKFSRASGFYDEEFKLAISAAEGTRIYYTLDGSDPDEHSAEYKEEIAVKDASSQENVYSSRTDFAPYYYGYTSDLKPHVAGDWYCRYSLPMGQVDKCTVVRAVAVDENGSRSDVVTGSYFVGFRKKEGYKDIAVMSLVSDPDGLFGSDKGIMVNGKKYKNQLKTDNARRLSDIYVSRKYCNSFRGRGRDWERKVHMDYFRAEDGELLFSQEAGLRLHGNTSRVGGSHKSFNLYARKEYDGCETFKASFFDTGLLSDKVTLMMGKDIRNYYFSKQMWTSEIPTQDYSMVQVFLDGEYWGVYAIQERYVSDAYMETHYNLDKEDYSLAKGGVTHYEVKNGNPYAVKSSFRVVRDFAQNQDLTREENYEKLCQMMDMDSYIRSYAARLYTGDQDWSYFKNQIMLYADNKWHWLIYDMDAGAGDREISRPDVNTFVTPRINPRFSLANDEVFPYLMKSPQFCARFTTVFMDMGNEVFRADRVKEEMEDFKRQYGAAGLKDVLRNPQDADFSRDNTAQSCRFTDTCDTISSYFSERYDYAARYLADYFGLKGKLAAVTIHNPDRKQGAIQINTIIPGQRVERAGKAETAEKAGSGDENEGGSRAGSGDENEGRSGAGSGDENREKKAGGREQAADDRWTGSYYTDYPVTLTALPEEGYHFLRWEIEKGKGKIKSEEASETELSFEGDVMVKVVFEKDTEEDKPSSIKEVS